MRKANGAALVTAPTEISGRELAHAVRCAATTPGPATTPEPATAPGYAEEFANLYRRNFSFVWRSASGLACGAKIVLEDVVQDVWLVVHQRWVDFRGDSNERTWLFGITRNVVLNHRRRLRRKGGLESLDDHDLPDDSASQREARAVWNDVQTFLCSLDEQRREVFVSRYLLEMSPGEIADATGRNLIAVYADARKLKGTFRRWLDARGES